MDSNQFLNALENESNASIMDLTNTKVKSQKNDILQQLQLPREKLKLFHKKLKNYRYCSDLRDIQYGHYIRWVPLKNPEKICLTNGGIICDIQIINNCIHIRCKNNRNHIIQFKFDECILFQKISSQEKVILSVLDYLDK
jgi:hypothetical protein